MDYDHGIEKYPKSKNVKKQEYMTHNEDIDQLKLT